MIPHLLLTSQHHQERQPKLDLLQPAAEHGSLNDGHHSLLFLLKTNCTTASWELPLLTSIPNATVKTKLILNLVTDENIDPQSSALMENNQTQSYWSVSLICQLKMSHFFFLREHWPGRVVLSLHFMWAGERIFVCLKVDYSSWDLTSYLIIFLQFSRRNKICFCTLCAKQQLAERQQQRKLGLTSGNVLVQKQRAKDNISQSQQHPLYPVDKWK